MASNVEKQIRAVSGKKGAFAVCLVGAALLVLLSVLLAVYHNAVDSALFERAVLKNVDYASVGLSEESAAYFATHTIDYLTDKASVWQPFGANSLLAMVIPESFTQHMAEVKDWVQGAQSWFIGIAALAFTLLLGAVATQNRNGRGGVSLGGYYAGVGLSLALVFGVLTWAYLDFDAMWGLLHRYLIPDGIFSAAEPIMRLFPPTVFQSYFQPVFISFGVMLGGVLVLPLLLKPLSLLVGKLKAGA